MAGTTGYHVLRFPQLPQRTMSEPEDRSKETLKSPPRSTHFSPPSFPQAPEEVSSEDATGWAGASDWAIASTIDRAGAEIELVTQFSRESRLDRALEPVRSEFDFILLDCPPSLGLLTVNALTAAA